MYHKFKCRFIVPVLQGFSAQNLNMIPAICKRDYLLLWSPRDKKLWYLDIEHEEFHPLAKWDDFIADPGRYLNGMIEGEFEE